MADLAFTRKYRPKSISEYMGSDIKQVVLNRFSDENNFPQVTLLYGTRGTGKTSLARLLAKECLCLDREDGHSCGKCEVCLDIEEKLIGGEFGLEAIGVQEVDVAADGGTANINAVLDEAVIEPSYPLKYKVVIFDEVHMLSNKLQNALLKLAEEPPRHLIMILCTTDPDKLLNTLLSRCQLKLEVKRASEKDLLNRLLYICEQEGIRTSNEALKVIIKRTERVPRESIMMLESVAKANNNEVTISTIQSAIGGLSNQIYVDYYEASRESLESILLFSKRLKENSIEPKKFIEGLVRFTLDALYIKYGIDLDIYPVEYVKLAKKVFNIYDSAELDALLQVLESAVMNLGGGVEGNRGDNVEKAELILITTAMRISKLDILSDNLGNEQSRGYKENKASLSAYNSLIHKAEEKQGVNGVSSRVSESDIAGIIGKEVAQLPDDIIKQMGLDSDIPVIPLEEDKDTDGKDELLTQEQLMKLFSEF